MKWRSVGRSGWRILMMPLSWPLLFTSAKDFSAYPILGSPFLNAAGLHVWRKLLADRICQFRRSRMRKWLPRHLTDQWDEAGVVRIDDFLDSDQWTAVCSDLARATFPMTEMTQSPASTRRANLDVQTCQGQYPGLLGLLRNENLMRLLEYAAGYRGKPLVAVQCIHSNIADSEGRHDPQTEWHSDTFHSTAKAWLFLHPVGANDGPFAYVPGSHRPTPARLAWDKAQSLVASTHPHRLHAKGSFRASEGELAAMGYGAPVVGNVPANTLMVADTSGFHRRCPSPAATVRVEIYFSLRRNPFLAGLYPSLLGLPWLRNHWAGCLFALYVLMRRYGIPSWNARAATGLDPAEKQALGRGLG